MDDGFTAGLTFALGLLTLGDHDEDDRIPREEIVAIIREFIARTATP